MDRSEVSRCRLAWAAAVASSLLATGGPALAAPLVCSSSTLLLGASPISDGVDSRCATPPDPASSGKSFGFVDSSGPGHGNWAASEGIEIGSASGGVHVSLAQVGTLETLYSAQAAGQVSDALVISDAALAGTAGTLEVPIHVTGGVAGTSENVPVTSPVEPPTISASFGVSCTGSFVGTCANQTVSLPLDAAGSASLPLDGEFPLAIPFVFGQQVFFNASFTLTAGLRGTHCFNCGVETTMSGNVDGSSLATFGAAIVRDANGDPVAGATIASDSGHDYAAPEPAQSEIALAAVGCLALLGAAREDRLRPLHSRGER